MQRVGDSFVLRKKQRTFYIIRKTEDYKKLEQIFEELWMHFAGGKILSKRLTILTCLFLIEKFIHLLNFNV